MGNTQVQGTKLQLLYGQLGGGEDRVQLYIGEVATGPLMWASDDAEGLLQFLGWQEQADASWKAGAGFAYLPRMAREWQHLLDVWGQQLSWPVCAGEHCYARLTPGWKGELCARCSGQEVAA